MCCNIKKEKRKFAFRTLNIRKKIAVEFQYYPEARVTLPGASSRGQSPRASCLGAELGGLVQAAVSPTVWP